MGIERLDQDQQLLAEEEYINRPLVGRVTQTTEFPYGSLQSLRRFKIVKKAEYSVPESLPANLHDVEAFWE